MAQIQFYANIQGNPSSADGELINHTAGSGLGFYGSDFGVSVPVNAKQTTTFVTDGDGISQGSQLNNTETVVIGTGTTVGTVKLNNSNTINLNNLPNYLCPLNIRFTHTEAVKVQNCKLRIFDRSSINNPASGVTTYVYESRHPSSLNTKTNLAHRARSNNTWVEFNPEANMALADGVEISDMPFTASPGVSGLNTSSSDTDTTLGYTTTDGPTHSSTRHDWYVAISSEPETIGSKTQYGLYFSVEYL